MFGIGGQELVLLMIIGLIVLGPERLPRIANQIGGWLGQARRMTRVMKRQLEEELDLNQPIIKPPPSSREPSQQPAAELKKEDEYILPRDDDEYSPVHGEDDTGTGVSEESSDGESDTAVTESEPESVTAAEDEPASTEDEAEEKKEAS